MLIGAVECGEIRLAHGEKVRSECPRHLLGKVSYNLIQTQSNDQDQQPVKHLQQPVREQATLAVQGRPFLLTPESKVLVKRPQNHLKRKLEKGF